MDAGIRRSTSKIEDQVVTRDVGRSSSTGPTAVCSTAARATERCDREFASGKHVLQVVLVLHHYVARLLQVRFDDPQEHNCLWTLALAPDGPAGSRDTSESPWLYRCIGSWMPCRSARTLAALRQVEPMCALCQGSRIASRSGTFRT
jgi:hypothetical protein